MSEFGDLVLVLGDHHIPTRKSDLPECFKELLTTDKIKTVLCTGNIGSKKAEESLHQIGQDVHCVKGESDPGIGCGPQNLMMGGNSNGFNPNAMHPQMMAMQQQMQQNGGGVPNGPGSGSETLPDSLVIEIGKFRVGLINGYQIVGCGGGGAAGGLPNNGTVNPITGTVGVDELALGRWQRKLGCDILVSGHTHKASVFERGGKLFLNPGSITGASQHYGDPPSPYHTVFYVDGDTGKYRGYFHLQRNQWRSGGGATSSSETRVLKIVI